MPRLLAVRLSLKIRLVLGKRDCKPRRGFAAHRSRAWVSLAVTLQRKIKDCSQSSMCQILVLTGLTIAIEKNSILTWSGFRPVKQNIPICSVICDQL